MRIYNKKNSDKLFDLVLLVRLVRFWCVSFFMSLRFCLYGRVNIKEQQKTQRETEARDFCDPSQSPSGSTGPTPFRTPNKLCVLQVIRG